MQTLELQKIANEVRKGIVTGVHSAKAGHPGGSLSAADIFTYLYFEEMNIDPKNPTDPDRDRFVLSKGHTAPGYYSAMAQRGYFPVEELLTLRHVGSRLQGHPCMQDLPGLQDLWDRESPQQLVWQLPENWTTNLIVYIPCWVMARFRKVRYGRLPCWLHIVIWTTW